MHNPPVAQRFPSDIDATSSNAPLEAATALRLGDELPEDRWVIHACHWTLPEGRHIGQGEIKFVVVSPGGSIGLIEQKNGSVAWKLGAKARGTRSVNEPQNYVPDGSAACVRKT